ncbi:MAG: hypothetical protein J6E42_05835 [Firmicutes bacterium]|nr:hypothetical protein [Bacillota bacterium]
MNHNSKISPNTVNKILSVIIAIFLWIFVIGGENPVKERTIRSVPVNLKNVETLADNNLAIAGSTDYTVDVKIKGQRTTVDPLTVDDITVEADLFGYGQGQNYINVTAVIPDNTELVEIRSPKIQVNIEELVAVSKPVHINFINVPAGKEIGGIIEQPTEVEVSGAKSLVNAVAWAFGTVNVNGSEEGKSNTVQVELQPLNDGEALVENVRMSSQYADVSFVIMDVKEVPLVVETKDESDGRVLSGIEAPETIEIRGLPQDLEQIHEVVTEPVDLAGLELNEDGSAIASLEAILPQGVELASKNPTLQATFQVKEVSAGILEFSGNEIEIRGLAEGLAADALEGIYTLHVKADEEVIDRLELSDVVLYVDGSQIREEGTFSLEILAEYGEEIDEVRVVPESAEVRVRSLEEE